MKDRVTLDCVLSQDSHLIVFSSHRPTYKHQINKILCHSRYNLSGKSVWDNKKNNCDESLPEDRAIIFSSYQGGS